MKWKTESVNNSGRKFFITLSLSTENCHSSQKVITITFIWLWKNKILFRQLIWILWVKISIEFWLIHGHDNTMSPSGNDSSERNNDSTFPVPKEQISKTKLPDIKIGPCIHISQYWVLNFQLYHRTNIWREGFIT